jgi:acetyltransferase-like isoleucine patch superfamily enzyme
VLGLAAINKETFMGNLACITAGRIVGAGAKIAAGSVVYTDVPAGAEVIGNPGTFRRDKG